MASTPRSGSVRIWSIACGLLSASVVTLVGVVLGLSPETILLRATVAALVLGAAAWLCSLVLK
jgi:hypothetical protein